MFGMVADTATNLSLGVEDPGGHLFIDAWIVFIREITASMVAPREASLKTCTYIIMIIVSILSINLGGGFPNLYRLQIFKDDSCVTVE